MGLVLRLDNDVAGARGEPAEARFRVERRVNLRHEALLRGLLGDAHALADLGPRRPGLAGLVDEVADEMVGDFAEGFGGEHGVGELIQRFGVHLLDDTDEVVEADGVGDLRWLGHAVNLRLTTVIRQPRVDDWCQPRGYPRRTVRSRMPRVARSASSERIGKMLASRQCWSMSDQS